MAINRTMWRQGAGLIRNNRIIESNAGSTRFLSPTVWSLVDPESGSLIRRICFKPMKREIISLMDLNLLRDHSPGSQTEWPRWNFKEPPWRNFRFEFIYRCPVRVIESFKNFGRDGKCPTFIRPLSILIFTEFDHFDRFSQFKVSKWEISGHLPNPPVPRYFW